MNWFKKHQTIVWITIIAVTIFWIGFLIGQIYGGLAVYKIFMCGPKTQQFVNTNFSIYKC